MKRIFKILLAVCIAIGTILPAAACGVRDKVPNSTTDIEIVYWKSGLGDQFLNEIIAGFKETHPEYSVYFKSAEVLSEINQTLLLGESGDTVDLYLTYFTDSEYTSIYENLDDVLDAVPEGETKTIREKFNPYVLDQLTRENGAIHTLSYGGGITSIVYNIEMLAGYELPKTSFELEMIVSELSGKTPAVTPFVHFSPEGYYDYFSSVWQAQYDGIDYFNNVFLANKDNVTGVAPSKSTMLKKDGRWKALEAMGKIFTPDIVLNNSNTMNHTSAQTKFLAGEAAMMVNGAWLQNEMKSEGGRNANISMMKMPVISSIIENLNTVKSESVLSAVIGEVDAVAAGEKTVTLTGVADNNINIAGYQVSESDWNRIYEARNMIHSNACEQVTMIPKYSNAKEGAKLFLQYFYSDEAIATYYNTAHMAVPANFSDGRAPDQTDWTDFEKINYSLLSTAVPVNRQIERRHNIFKDGGAHPYADVKLISQLTAKGAARKTSAQIWSQVESAINSKWSGWLTNIGMGGSLPPA